MRVVRTGLQVSSLRRQPLSLFGVSSVATQSYNRVQFLRSYARIRTAEAPKLNFDNRPTEEEKEKLKEIQRKMDEEHDVEGALKNIQARIQTVVTAHNLPKQPRLVAVSKTKPVSVVKRAYDAGQRHFGENYVQELVEKAPQMPKDVCWHYIGHLQSKKCKVLAAMESLYMIETLDSVNLAQTLQKAAQNYNKVINVMIQINTSGQASKSGARPEECVEIVKQVQGLKNLKFCGLMTIGDPDVPPERDFGCLINCRKEVCEKLGLSENDVELSMGMSHDFEKAVEMGSTNVRVGSSIFGTRDYTKASSSNTSQQ